MPGKSSSTKTIPAKTIRNAGSSNIINSGGSCMAPAEEASAAASSISPSSSSSSFPSSSFFSSTPFNTINKKFTPKPGSASRQMKALRRKRLCINSSIESGDEHSSICQISSDSLPNSVGKLLPVTTPNFFGSFSDGVQSAADEQRSFFPSLSSSTPLPKFQNKHFQHLISPSLFLPLHFLIPLLLLLLLPISPCASVPVVPSDYSSLTVPVGSIFLFDAERSKTPASQQSLPSWMRVDAERRVFGVPQIRDLGRYQLMLQGGGNNISLDVTEEQQSPCPAGVVPIWLEVFDPRNFYHFSIEEQFKFAESFLRDFGSIVAREDLRLFPFSYLERFRVVQGEPLVPSNVETSSETTVLAMNISCGETSEQAADLISSALEKGIVLQVVQGTLVKAKPPSSVLEPSPEKKKEGERQNSGTAGGEPSPSSSSTAALLVTVLLFVAVLVLVSVLAYRWFRAKHLAQKRRKQLLTETNGNGLPATTPRPSAFNSTSNSKAPTYALSPDVSMQTVTTPMLGGGGGNNENATGGEEAEAETAVHNNGKS